MALSEKTSEKTARAIDLYKQTRRSGTHDLRDVELSWLLEIMTDGEQDTYYRLAADYRVALATAERTIEWP